MNKIFEAYNNLRKNILNYQLNRAWLKHEPVRIKYNSQPPRFSFAGFRKNTSIDNEFYNSIKKIHRLEIKLRELQNAN